MFLTDRFRLPRHARNGTGRSCALAAVLAVLLSAAAAAAEDAPHDRYRAALASERGLRAPGPPAPLAAYRTTIAAYETLARRYPRSGLRDQALWQGAGLSIEAYDLYRQPLELEAGRRLLEHLDRLRPPSAFASRVAERLTQLEALTALASIQAVQREDLPGGTRIIVTIDRDVPIASTHAPDPARLYFDFPHTTAAVPLRNATLAFAADPMVRAVRLDRRPRQSTRIALDLEVDSSALCNSVVLYDPVRLIIDCLPPPLPDGPELLLLADLPFPAALVQPVAPPVALAEPTPPAAYVDGSLSVARQLGLGVSRIVIDAGHGGHDPGACSNDLCEADLVLDVALRLERRLAAAYPQLDVVLTRREDVYVGLEERTAIANRNQADLFLSIHANASLNHASRGVETYFLDFATHPTAAAVAARENRAGGGTMRNLTTLVEAITTNSKVDESRDLAHVVQTTMVDGLQRVEPDLPNRGVKQAPFTVLIGARMPSVLTEIAFLSNTRDASLLASDAYRDQVAEALADGIARYQRELGIRLDPEPQPAPRAE